MPLFDVKREGGFTLVELMVVLLIMVALAALVLTGYSESFPRLAVERAAESFIGDLYRTREKSFSPLAYEENGEIVKYDQGLFVKADSDDYVVFLDKNGSKEYNEAEDEIMETINMERKVMVSNVKVGADTKAEVNILFSFEEREVFFNGEKGLSAEITFQARADEKLKRIVHIDSSGIAKIIHE